MANDTCYGRPPYFTDLVWYLMFFTYNVAAPLYFILGLSGHAVLLFAFLKQLKSQRAYMYQVYCAGVRTSEALFRTLYYCSMHLFIYGNGVRISFIQESLARCYGCAWFSARLSTPLSTSWTTTSLLLSVAMAADRVYALLKPSAYNNKPHDTSQRVVFVLCVLIGFGASAFDVMRTTIIPSNQGLYSFGVNTTYMNLPIVKFLAYLRIAIQATAVSALVALSMILCNLYRSRFVNGKAKVADQSAQARAKEKERTLLLLTFVECSLTTTSMCVTMVHYAVTYGDPAFYDCWRQVMNPTHDVSRMIIDVCNFYVVLCVCRQIRKTIGASMRSCFGSTAIAGGGQPELPMIVRSL